MYSGFHLREQATRRKQAASATVAQTVSLRGLLACPSPEKEDCQMTATGAVSRHSQERKPRKLTALRWRWR
jgi:hypothetical protein